MPPFSIVIHKKKSKAMADQQREDISPAKRYAYQKKLSSPGGGSEISQEDSSLGSESPSGIVSKRPSFMSSLSSRYSFRLSKSNSSWFFSSDNSRPKRSRKSGS